MDLTRMRHDYETKGLSEADVDADPMRQFQLWLNEAVAAGVTEPNAMVVSTVDASGAPHSRHLLLKGLSGGGFEFFTNYNSAKGSELSANPAVALTFPWLALHRQVNVAGTAAKVNEADSDAYFAMRPRGSQLGAWASDQSAELRDRAVLERELDALEERFSDMVPRPPHWGGYRVVPSSIEFWQGRPSRLHDRLAYRHQADGSWTLVRLSP